VKERVNYTSGKSMRTDNYHTRTFGEEGLEEEEIELNGDSNIRAIDRSGGAILSFQVHEELRESLVG